MKAVIFSLDYQLGRLQNQLRGAPLGRPVRASPGSTNSTHPLGAAPFTDVVTRHSWVEEAARAGRSHVNLCSGTARVPPALHRLNHRQEGKGQGGHAGLGLGAARRLQGSCQGCFSHHAPQQERGKTCCYRSRNWGAPPDTHRCCSPRCSGLTGTAAACLPKRTAMNYKQKMNPVSSVYYVLHFHAKPAGSKSAPNHS